MLKLFKLTAILEGISFLVLLFNMLVIKKINFDLGNSLTFSIGMAHGLLFVGYVLLAIMLKDQMKWNGKNFFLILIASVIPFATFWIERKYLSEKS